MATYQDRDGNLYHSVIIGTQEWIVENLKTTKYKDGSTIPLITDPAQWAKAGDSGGLSPDSNCVKYGMLYNQWCAAKNYGMGSGSIAPSGWHVPFDNEWGILVTFLDPLGTSSSNIAGRKLKEIGTTYWNAPNTGATNEIGFNLRGTGQRIIDGTFIYNKELGAFWQPLQTNISVSSSPYARYDNDILGYSDMSFNIVSYNKTGLPIRCVKDSTSLTHGQTGTVTDIDGNIYPTICIGSTGSEQEWMSINLRVTKFNDGTLISEVTDNSTWTNLTTPGRCFYNNEICDEITPVKDAYCWYNNLK